MCARVTGNLPLRKWGLSQHDRKIRTGGYEGGAFRLGGWNELGIGVGTGTFWFHYLYRGVMGNKAKEMRRDWVVATLNAKPKKLVLTTRQQGRF